MLNPFQSSLSAQVVFVMCERTQRTSDSSSRSQRGLRAADNPTALIRWAAMCGRVRPDLLRSESSSPDCWSCCRRASRRCRLRGTERARAGAAGRPETPADRTLTSAWTTGCTQTASRWTLTRTLISIFFHLYRHVLVFCNVMHHFNQYARYCYREHFKIQSIII